MLSPLARLLFPTVDDNLLDWVYDDNQRVEPEWYCPIIPLVLVNGAEGIGTGWSTKMPNHDVRTVLNNCKRYIRGEELEPMLPDFKNFKGWWIYILCTLSLSIYQFFFKAQLQNWMKIAMFAMVRHH